MTDSNYISKTLIGIAAIRSSQKESEMKLVDTTSPANSNLDAERLSAFRNLEHDVCSVKNMAALAANALEDFLDPTHSKGKAATDELQFAVNHVEEMAEALRRKFYTAWGGGPHE